MSDLGRALIKAQNNWEIGKKSWILSRLLVSLPLVLWMTNNQRMMNVMCKTSIALVCNGNAARTISDPIIEPEQVNGNTDYFLQTVNNCLELCNDPVESTPTVDHKPSHQIELMVDKGGRSLPDSWP